MKRIEYSRITTRAELELVIDHLSEIVQSAIDASTPWSRISDFSKEWWTPECSEAVHRTRSARRTYTKRHTQEAWEEYVSIKNRKGKVIAKAKRDHFRERMRVAGESQEAFWKTAKWATQRVKGIKGFATIPTLRRDVIIA